MTGAGEVAPSGTYTVASSWMLFVVVALVSPLVVPEATAGTAISVSCVVKVPPLAANKAQKEKIRKHPQRFLVLPVVIVMSIPSFGSCVFRIINRRQATRAADLTVRYGVQPHLNYSLQRQVHPALALVRWSDGFGRNDEDPFGANLAGLQQVLLHPGRARLHQGAEIVWRDFDRFDDSPFRVR